MKLKHRNSQKRIYIKDACYFITVKTYNNFPYFKEKIFCDLFLENLRLCKSIYDFMLFGFVLIHDHFHLIILPKDELDLSGIMFSIKKQFSHNCNILIGYNLLYLSKHSSTVEGAQSIARLRGKWFGADNSYNKNLINNIYNFDKYILSSKSRFQIQYPNHKFPKFKWQKSYYDHYIRNKKDFNRHLKYIENNPTKHNLPDDWPYVFTNPQYYYLTDTP